MDAPVMPNFPHQEYEIQFLTAYEVFRPLHQRMLPPERVLGGRPAA
jgi:hypothetical protein